MPTELVWSNQARTDLLEIYMMIGLEQPPLPSGISIASRTRPGC
jgi:hypothetical protein